MSFKAHRYGVALVERTPRAVSSTNDFVIAVSDSPCASAGYRVLYAARRRQDGASTASDISQDDESAFLSI
jgi:hypothetical protein